MKKLLFLSLSVIAIAGLASATPVLCSITMAPNSSGNSTTLCTISAPGGSYINSLTLTGTDDWSGYFGFGAVSVDFSGTISQTAGLSTPFTDPTFCTVFQAGSSSIPCSITANPSVTIANSNEGVTSYSLSLINVGNVVNRTTAGITNATVSLSLDYTTALQTGPAPEPATLGLMGTALLGLGFLARKKK